MSTAVLAAMEENLHEHVAYVQRRVPGMTVEDRPDLLLVDSGLPTDTFNKICRARLRGTGADSRIREAVAHFSETARPFAWWLGPLSEPEDLGSRLEACGLTAGESEVGMYCEMDGLGSSVPDVEGLEIRSVRNAAELRAFAEVSAGNWTPPDGAVIDFFARAAGVLLRDDCPMRLFVGYFGGEPAAASELFLRGSTAGVHMVSTRKPFRRRGIGLAMTWAAVDEGRRLGATLATLQASEEGRSVYERLGFKACGEFVEYLPLAG